jgi:hypothetical protein
VDLQWKDFGKGEGMRKTDRRVFLGMVFFLLPIVGADCDCTHFPWSKDCYRQCGGKIARQASRSQLTDGLGLSEDTADAIIKYRRTHDISTLDDLPAGLGTKVEAALRNLSDEELKSLYGES